MNKFIFINNYLILQVNNTHLFLKRNEVKNFCLEKFNIKIHTESQST